MADNKETHGAYSAVRALKEGKSIDKRTRLGKEIARSRQRLLDELGRVPTESELYVLDQIIEKRLFCVLIRQWELDKENEGNIIDEKGVLLPCLGQNYISYSESLRRWLKDWREICKIDGAQSDLYDQWREQFVETPSKMQEKTTRKGPDCPSRADEKQEGK